MARKTILYSIVVPLCLALVAQVSFAGAISLTTSGYTNDFDLGSGRRDWPAPIYSWSGR